MADSTYSVSLPRQRSSTGPKPMEKRSTPTPHQRATKKWPSSWIRIRMPMTRTKDTIISIGPPRDRILPTVHPLAGPRVDPVADATARPRVDVDAGVDGDKRGGRL